MGRISYSAYAERRRRPLARRALITSRPPLVAMRARKPWLRLRLILLGWKVRFCFIIIPLKTGDLKIKRGIYSFIVGLSTVFVKSRLRQSR